MPRPLLRATLAIFLFSSATFAQDLQQSNSIATNNPNPVVVERGANHRVWKSVIAVRTNQVSRIIPAKTNQLGQVTPESTNRFTNVTYRAKSYTELSPGLHYQSGSNWLESSEAIQITQDGGAATNGQHRASLAANINTSGSIHLTTPDGKQLRSHVVGLSYFDSSANTNVLFGILKDSTGFLVGSNRVVYSNAFSNIIADIRETYTRGGFEQDIVLKEQPPAPSTWGLSTETTWLQVWTEFLDPPQAQLAPGQDGGAEVIGFGIMQIGPGRAFVVGNESNSVPVRKHWVTAQGRTFLLEEVQLSSVAVQLQGLPPYSGTNGAGMGGGQAQFNFPNELPPRPKLAIQGSGGLRIASLPTKESGFVMDYNAVITDTNVTFHGDTTYYVSGAVTLSGTTTLEGGAVIKFTNNAAAGITLNGLLVTKAGPYRPAIFTSKNDDSVGDSIPGSSGSPANTGAVYLSGSGSQTNVYKYLRMSYAGTGITNSGAATVWHSQFINVGTAVGAGTNSTTLRNVLISHAANCTFTTGPIVVEHLTADACSNFDGATPSSAKLTNSLLSSVTNQPTWTSSTSSVTSGSGLYQTVGGGSYYLANGSTNRDAGNTNIDANLGADLKKMTTYPPSDEGSYSLADNTVWSAAVGRDTDVPDRGYHYDALDHLVSGISLGGGGDIVLTLTNGVAIGTYGTSGFAVYYGSGIVSEGTPTNLNRIVWCANVQEQGQTTGSFFDMPIGDQCNPGMTFLARFTDIAAVGTQGYLLTAGDGQANAFASWMMENSTLRGLHFESYPYTTGHGMAFGMTNCALERCLFEIGKDSNKNPYPDLNVALRNNLFWRGTATLTFNIYGNETSPWQILDNAFDNESPSASGDGFGSGSIIGNNGYVNASSPWSEGGAVSAGSFNYADAALGQWYQASTDFVDRGNTTADQLGMFHYTTATNQVREQFSTIDIGFHYLAVDGNGNLIDSDGDHTPDYLEDSNGNGWVDGGESQYMTTVTNSAGITGLIIFTPLKQ